MKTNYLSAKPTQAATRILLPVPILLQWIFNKTSMENTAKRRLTQAQRRFVQKRKMNKELVNLAVFAACWFQAEDLHYTDSFRRKRCLDKLRELLGGPDGPGLLQIKMNQKMDGILDRLQADFPDLRLEEQIAFTHAAAGLTNDLSARLIGLRTPYAASVLKSRLRERILCSGSPHTDEYLVLLPPKGCRFGEEMLYLHNLKYRTTWKL